jgi:hypothetical protein
MFHVLHFHVKIHIRISYSYKFSLNTSRKEPRRLTRRHEYTILSFFIYLFKLIHCTYLLLFLSFILPPFLPFPVPLRFLQNLGLFFMRFLNLVFQHMVGRLGRAVSP